MSAYDFSKDLENVMVRASKWAMNNPEREAEILERSCVAVAVTITLLAHGDLKLASTLLNGAETYIGDEVSRIFKDAVT